jgi:hypothetical protein
MAGSRMAGIGAEPPLLEAPQSGKYCPKRDLAGAERERHKWVAKRHSYFGVAA